MTALFGLGLLAWGLQPAEEVRLQLVGGETMEGWVSDASPGLLLVTTNEGLREVPVPLVEEATIGGRTLDANTLEEEIVEMLESERTQWQGQAHPHPLLTATASAMWAGGGQATLGQWDRAVAYGTADLICLGLASWFLLAEESPGQAVPLVAFSVLFRGYSVSEAWREARRRKRVTALLELASPTAPSGPLPP